MKWLRLILSAHTWVVPLIIESKATTIFVPATTVPLHWMVRLLLKTVPVHDPYTMETKIDEGYADTLPAF